MKKGFWVGLGLGLAVGSVIGLAEATTIVSGRQAIEQMSQAPWIFVGQVIESELVDDPLTSPHANRLWRSRNTRFQVLRKVKGTFGKGNEVTLKECSSSQVISKTLVDAPTLCLLANQPPNYQIGDTFLIFTGPGHARQNQYQVATHMRVSRVPIRRELNLKSQEGQKDLERDLSYNNIPSAPSGWVVDLSNTSLWIQANPPSGAPHRLKGEVMARQYGLTSDESAIVGSRGLVDLDLFLGIVGKMKK